MNLILMLNENLAGLFYLE